jgi:predicted CoA-substrate-specific enzyme activase
MPFAGMDIGSRSIELVVIENNDILRRASLPTTHNPLEQVNRMLNGDMPVVLCATGYGRKLVAQTIGCRTVSEISAYARGARYLDSSVRSIIDIGGQDTKLILLAENGAVSRFEMNDRCAAGTGRFLEVMAVSFQMPVEELGSFALTGKPGITISSMCTVFAESEVTSLIARGAKSADVAYAIHESAVKRTMAMLERVGSEAQVMFAGGVAHNACIVKLLNEAVSSGVTVPEYPEYVGALGAALVAASSLNAA